MISYISVFCGVGIVVIAYTMHSFMNEYCDKGVQFSARSFVLRSFGYAAMTLALVIAFIAYLVRSYELYDSFNPDVRVLDLYVGLAFFWALIANCYLALLLLRAYDRMNDQQN